MRWHTAELQCRPALFCGVFWSTMSGPRSPAPSYYFPSTAIWNMHALYRGGGSCAMTYMVCQGTCVCVCVLDWPLPHADIPSHHRWAPDVAAGPATLKVKGRGNHGKFATHILVRWWDKERVRELELWKFTSQANKNYESLHVVRLEKTKGYIWEMIM